MLKSNVHMAVVGNNYFSYLLSISLLKRGKDVLILDDSRFNYGELFLNTMTGMDLEFLRAFGEKFDLGPLKNIESYARSNPTYFFVGKKQVLLGNAPAENLIELGRKFPEFFLDASVANLFSDDYKQTINSQYYEFNKRLFDQVFDSLKKEKTFTIFEASFPMLWRNYFERFFSQYLKEKDLLKKDRSDLNTLTVMARGIFQNRLSTTGTRLELIHLFFSLVSPLYRLDHEKLIEDLSVEFKALKGEVKKLDIKNIKMGASGVKSFDLDSYDGHISPKVMAFLGGNIADLPIRLKASGIYYNCIKTYIPVKHKALAQFAHRSLIFSSGLKIGTERPLFYMSLQDDHLEVYSLILNQSGFKIDFVKDATLKTLEEDLKYIFPELEFNFEAVKIVPTLDVFVEEKDYLAHSKKEHGITAKLVEVLDNTRPLIFKRLNNVHYFGPYNNHALGTFSALYEINQWKDRL